MLLNQIASTIAAIVIAACSTSHTEQTGDGSSTQSDTTRRTPPAPFTFLFIGDAGVRDSIMLRNAANADAYYAVNPLNAMFYLGDNFYQRGLDDDPVKRKKQVAAILGPFMPLMAKLGPQHVHSVPGNHDYSGGIIGNSVGGMGLDQKRAELGSTISQWTFHIQGAERTTYPLAAGSADSVDFIYLNTSMLVGKNDDGKRWKYVFGQLEKVLDTSARSPHIKWRILCAHHSPYSVGIHGAYGNYLNLPCGRLKLSGVETAMGQVEDLLAGQATNNKEYKRYTDTLMKVIGRSGAKVQIFLAGHDHSLQVFEHPNPTCENCPATYIISGAGAKVAGVRESCPPVAYTHPIDIKNGKGISVAGISFGKFISSDTLAVWFVHDETGKVLNMGGKDTFRIGVNGRLAR